MTARSSLSTPIGPLYLTAGARGLTAVSWAPLPAGAGNGKKDNEAAAYLEWAMAELTDYFAGRPDPFTVPLDPARPSTFAGRVLAETARIPRGTVLAYAELARLVGVPGGARAVGRALGTNPLPVVIPCHRVVRSDGSPGGYTEGAAIRGQRPDHDPWRKRWLLAHEGVTLPAAPKAAR